MWIYDHTEIEHCPPQLQGSQCNSTDCFIHTCTFDLKKKRIDQWPKRWLKCLIFHFRFLLLSLEPDHNCGYDYVEVRDGDGLSSPVIGRFCGDQLPPPIKSSGSVLHILFSSDGYNNFNGFVLIFQESAGRYSHYKQSSITPLTPRKASL